MTMTDMNFVALHAEGRLLGEGAAINGVSTDSRRIQPGELFVALSGPRFDGHDFAAAAIDKGAAGVVVERELDVAVPQVIVDDGLAALARLAAAWRGNFSLPLIGITGSSGKTTVKQMLRAILAECGEVLATEGNLNNEIGVPLTLLGLREHHRYAVVEMGANHRGEIASLTTIARPTIGVITNAGAAHLEGFGSLEGVVESKGEMYAGVVDGGVCVINGDQPWAEEWRERAGARRKVMFGIAAAHEFHVPGAIEESARGLGFHMHTPDGGVDVQLPLHGRHNVMNALAAATASWVAGANLDAIAQGLANVVNVGGRMRIEPLDNGVVLVDDTYNANPLSMRAAIDWLAAGNRRGWLVMGDMGELGAEADVLHAEIGAYAAECGIERLYGLGPLSRAACTAFGSARAFDDPERLVAALADDMEQGVTVLIKGSRAARMERIADGLRERGNG